MVHPEELQRRRWAVIDRLDDLLEFTPDDKGSWTWKCGNPDTADRLAYTKQALAEVGGGLTMAELTRGSHCCCDCEVSFSCDDRPDDDEEPEAPRE